MLILLVLQKLKKREAISNVCCDQHDVMQCITAGPNTLLVTSRIYHDCRL